MRYDIIAFVLISIIALGSIAYSAWLFIKNRKLLKTIVELHVDRMALENLISNQALSNEQPVDQGDGFIKFLSESREWAFNYIEEVQKQIEEFRSSVSPEILVFKSGKKLEKVEMEMMLNRISTAFYKLESVLPQEDTQNKEK